MERRKGPLRAAYSAGAANPNLENVRRIELTRLDNYLLALNARIEAGDEKAINTALRIAQRRADLLGIDAPKRIEATGKDGAPLTWAELALKITTEDTALLTRATQPAQLIATEVVTSNGHGPADA